MTLSGFYLFCFAVGFCFSVLSALAGSHHFHLHLHAHGHGHAPGRGGASPFNAGTIAAFLAWFGGAGYLLTEYSAVELVLALGIAVLCGLSGAAIVFRFMARLSAAEKPLDPADYEMIGVLGRVSSPIRAGGTGEMIYAREGTRRACPVRAEDETVISRDTEVIVTRYEKGIAYVRPWEQMTSEHTS